MLNAGKYNHQIIIFKIVKQKDSQGFPKETQLAILKPYAHIKTTRGYTLIANNSDFEKAYTNFTIRYPKVEITRDMLIEFNSKIYEIQYLNNIDEANIELEIQAKEVTK